MRGGHRPRLRIHPLVQPCEDQTVAGLEKPGRIQNKPGAGRIGNNSKKTSAAPYRWPYMGKQLQEDVPSPSI